MDEPGLIRLFVDLTGATESAARCVVIYLELLERDYYPAAVDLNGGGSVSAAANGAPEFRDELAFGDHHRPMDLLQRAGAGYLH